MKKLFQKILSWFRKEKPAKKVPVKKAPETFSGKWTLRELLEKLPEYHRAAFSERRRLTRDNGEIQGAFRMGPYLPNDDSLFYAGNKIHKMKTLPAVFFVGLAVGKLIEGGKNDRVPACFVLAVKVKQPLTVEWLPGQCYSAYICYKIKDGISFWATGYFFVHNNKVTAAKEVLHYQHKITRNGKLPCYVPKVRLGNNIADECDKENGKNAGEFAFATCLNFWRSRNEHWLVVTKKDGQRVSFSIHERQHIYFFRDRDKIATTPTGKRKTIFHIVTGHERKIMGKTVWVNKHTRGVRHFFWNGFECHIFAPGWHGRDVGEITFEAFEESEHEGVPIAPAMEKLMRMMEGTNRR